MISITSRSLWSGIKEPIKSVRFLYWLYVVPIQLIPAKQYVLLLRFASDRNPYGLVPDPINAT
ncbi:hypothetical protein EMIT0194P_130110 [Pseudomonas serbica]